MSNNKKTKKKMMEKYGEECMIEAADIRYIPDYLDDNLQWRSEEDNKLTYHHIKPVSEGGETTEENGAIIRWNNHKWLESLPKEEREKVNKELQEFKAFLEWKRAKEKEEGARLNLMKFRVNNKDKIDMSDTMEIPLIPNRNIDKEEER